MASLHTVRDLDQATATVHGWRVVRRCIGHADMLTTVAELVALSPD